MTRFTRRRGYSASRRPRTRFQKILWAIPLFLQRVAYGFVSLQPGARIAAVGICAAVLIGGALLILLPPNDKKPSEQGVIALQNSTFAASDADEPLVMATPTPSPTPDATPTPSPTPDITLQVGVEDSERVTELQERLMQLGYLDIDETTQHFGPATKYAVQLFQRQHGLEQNGVADAQIQELMYAAEVKKYTLMEGTRGTDVDNFQQQLKELGYLSKVTGYYGTETIDAVKAFQKENGLHVDGKAGQETFDRVNSDKAKPSPSVAKEKRRKANVSTMIDTAKKQLGDKYILGNTGPNSFDCSGLVYYCLKEAGSNRRRLNAAGYSQVSDWEKISFSKLQKGDLLFFYDNGRTKVGHVGIYIGGGEMVDASSSNGKVVRRSCTTSYWKSHFVCARRPW